MTRSSSEESSPAQHPSPSRERRATERPRALAPGEGDRLRDEILDAAEHLLVETADANAVSIRAISQFVGVTAPSIYRHFDDKDALLFATCQRAYDRFDDYLAAEAGSEEDPLHDIKAQARAYLRFALDNPGQYRFLFMTPNAHLHPESLAGANAFEPGELESKALVRLRLAIQAAIDQGLIAPLASAEQMALLLWAMVHGIASLRIVDPDLPWPDEGAQIEGMFRALALGFCTAETRARLEGR